MRLVAGFTLSFFTLAVAYAQTPSDADAIQPAATPDALAEKPAPKVE